jgi:hypothetical protein
VATAMRTCSISLAGLALLASAGATTLQKLSLDDMIHQSTGIVRAKVTGSHAALRGQSIYTYYHLQVLEAVKAGGSQEIDVAVPGGTFNGIRQVAVGSPQLTTGSEYVVFLWAGKSGMNQIIGLSQGLFHAAKDASGNISLTRPAAEDLMLDQDGKAVSGESLGLRWTELRARIQKELGK